MDPQTGGCLCGDCRYQVTAPPLRVTTCHCRYCQKTTGSAYMVEPIFDIGAFGMVSGAPKIWGQLSEGSGKHVWLHFCGACGTRLYLSFERFDQIIGVFAGTFDDPNWFEISPDNARHIFLSSAMRGTIIPANIETYAEHNTALDGTRRAPVIFEAPRRL